LYGAAVVPEFPYGTDLGFAFYDLMVNGQYQADYQLNRFMNTTNLSRVPILYRGKYNSLALKHAEGPSKLGVNQPKAGIVIKSTTAANHPAIGRKLLLKYSPEFVSYQSIKASNGK